MNEEKKMARVCKVIVNSMPEYAVGKYVVATYDSDTTDLWFYGAWDTPEEAAKVAAKEGKLIVKG